MVAQMFHLTSAERKTLLVAGAAAGMSATFAAPISSVLLAIELLLFERKPRSIIPVALASGTAALVRQYLLGQGPLFPATPHTSYISPMILLVLRSGWSLCGLVAIPLLELVLHVRGFIREIADSLDVVARHRRLGSGIGGPFFSASVGRGLRRNRSTVRGDRALHLVLGVLIVKWLIWSIALGSGTSGGVFSSGDDDRSGAGRIVFLRFAEYGSGILGHDWHWSHVERCAARAADGDCIHGGANARLEYVAAAFNRLPWLLMRCPLYCCDAPILTEKVARRGYHLSAEYAVDPLELLYVREVMRTNIVALPASLRVSEAGNSLQGDSPQGSTIGAGDKRKWRSTRNSYPERIGATRRNTSPERQSPVRRDSQADERRKPIPMSRCVWLYHRMAETGVTRMPVVEHETRLLVGIVSLEDLLKARTRHLEEERHREQIFQWRYFNPGAGTIDGTGVRLARYYAAVFRHENANNVSVAVSPSTEMKK